MIPTVGAVYDRAFVRTALPCVLDVKNARSQTARTVVSISMLRSTRVIVGHADRRTGSSLLLTDAESHSKKERVVVVVHTAAITDVKIPLPGAHPNPCRYPMVVCSLRGNDSFSLCVKNPIRVSAGRRAAPPGCSCSS